MAPIEPVPALIASEIDPLKFGSGTPAFRRPTLTGAPEGLLGALVIVVPTCALAGCAMNPSTHPGLIVVAAGKGDSANVWLGDDGDPAHAPPDHVPAAAAQLLSVAITLTVMVTGLVLIGVVLTNWSVVLLKMLTVPLNPWLRVGVTAVLNFRLADVASSSNELKFEFPVFVKVT